MKRTRSSSSIAIPLSKLTELLQNTQVVKVSRSWLEAVQEANDINFGLTVTKSTESAEDTEDEDAEKGDERDPVIKVG